MGHAMERCSCNSHNAATHLLLLPSLVPQITWMGESRQNGRAEEEMGSRGSCHIYASEILEYVIYQAIMQCGSPHEQVQ